MSKFWTFNQNNSGGRFVVNDNVSEVVIIEAHNMTQANKLAESVGLYFDGVGDCNCCGNRWSEQWDEEDGTNEPMIYDEPAREYVSKWFDKKITIHYLDGRKERFDTKKEVV